MPRAWRIVREEQAGEAFDAASADGGGRWNSPGNTLIYTSETPSLAILELLVHVDDPATLPPFVLVHCDIPEELIERVEGLAALPRDWAGHPPPETLKEIGDGWARRGSAPALSVPSAVTEIERNYVLNPQHPDFRCIAVGGPRPCKLDFRLVKPGGDPR